MSRLLKSPLTRFLAYLIVLTTEGGALYFSHTLGLSVGATIAVMVGVAFVLLVAAFDLPYFLMRGRWRYKQELVGNEKAAKGGKVGQHLSEFFRLLRKSRVARYVIRWPMRIANLTTFVITVWLAWKIGAAVSDARWTQVLGYAFTRLPDARYLLAGYLPLLISVPFVLEFVTDWRSRLYVLLLDRKAHTARLVIIDGLWDGDSESVSLKRTVSMHVHQSGIEKWFISRGTIEIHETAGGSGEKLEMLWKPFRFKRLLQSSINNVHDSEEE